MGRFPSVLLIVASVTQVLSLCSHNTFLHPRAEGGAVEVKTFGYVGNIGPLFWATLEVPANSVCATGTRQSPIDMREGTFNMIPASDLSIEIPDFPAGTEFENLGTTVEIIGKGGELKFGDKTFTFQQAHFHLPSEHLDNGTTRAMEMHAVWQSENQEIAVIGTYIDIAIEGAAAVAPIATAPTEPPAAAPPAEVGAAVAPAYATEGVVEAVGLPAPVQVQERSWLGRFRRRSEAKKQQQQKRQEVAAPPSTAASAFLETIFSKVGEIATPGTVTETPPLVISEVVNLWKAGSFQGYSGSLTTPPCSEGVHWLVSTQTLRVSAATFFKVRDVLGFNSRITQNAPGKINVMAEAAMKALTLAVPLPAAAA
ncbi:alpha carbonic anhydrase [Apodospora peruviana]|uniref:carbonic anhydrase n=1 Tax=Apodospora peruviana TaxID=516989 RepID=A0AAE0HZP4_9PEZI|nr:alpha carbonic anhydrase [Apodospora peruviana]